MKQSKYILFGLILFIAALATSAWAQATNTVPADGAGALPASVSQYWDLLIAAISPLIVGAIDKIVPRVPRWLLPSIAPFVGMGLGFALNKLAGAHLGWVDMAKAGALAVFVREVFNQAVTKNLPSPTVVGSSGTATN